MKKLAPLGALVALVFALVPLALLATPGPTLHAMNGPKVTGVSVASSGTVTLLAPTSGTKLGVRYVVFSGDTAGLYTLSDSASSAVLAKFYCSANGSVTLTDAYFGGGPSPIQVGGGRLSATDAILKVTGPSASTSTASISYVEE